ncbi:MAG: hypothetical protein Hals2KO_37090 [Halioglobus sp.]|jgi:hypothetical protein
MTRHDTAQRDNAESRQDTSATRLDNVTTAMFSKEDHAATEQIYTLSVPQVRTLLIEAGHIVSERTLIRWCSKDLLDAALRPEENGQYDKYYITEASVLKKIDQLDRVRPATPQPRSEPGRTETNYGDAAKVGISSRNSQDTAAPAEHLPRHGSTYKRAGDENPDTGDLHRKVQELNDQILMKNVDIQIKDQLLIREKEVTREAWSKIAEVGEQVGRWKAKCEKLELAATSASISDREAQEKQPRTIQDSEILPEIKIVGTVDENGEAEDKHSLSTSDKQRGKRIRKRLKIAFFSMIIVLLVLIALTFVQR